MGVSRYSFVLAVCAAVVIGFLLGAVLLPTHAAQSALTCPRRAGLEAEYAYHHHLFKQNENRLRCIYEYAGVMPPVTETPPVSAALPLREVSSAPEVLHPPESTAEATP